MQRRSLLIWFGRAVYTACAAVVAAPVLRFLTAPTAAKSAGGGALRRRVARLDDLPVGEPKLLLVKGARQDGWTRHAEQVVGRVWVTRTSGAGVPPGQAKLAVFNAACPHSGCVIAQVAPKGFACHCHGAKFAADGAKVPNAGGYINPSPRGMDPLEHAVVKDESSGQWWVEVDYKAFETGLEKRVEKA